MDTSLVLSRLGRESAVPAADRPVLASWRLTGIGVLRIVFGLVWGIDAWFKWQPDFVNNFVSYLPSDGQPDWIVAWMNFWITIVKGDPQMFAHMVAIGETAVALALILGVFSNVTYIGGSLLSLGIWTTAEGFGGPYDTGATDIGAAIIYVLVFTGLFLSNAGSYLGLDQRLTPILGRVGFLASGVFKQRKDEKSKAHA